LGAVRRSALTLRFSGDDLDPTVITRTLGHQPSLAYAKGAPWTTPRGKLMVGRTGVWNLSAGGRTPADLDAQVGELFYQLAMDLTAWRSLSARFRGELFVGLFHGDYNEGMSVAAATLAAIADRGLGVDLDIYGAEDSD